MLDFKDVVYVFVWEKLVRPPPRTFPSPTSDSSVGLGTFVWLVTSRALVSSPSQNVRLHDDSLATPCRLFLTYPRPPSLLVQQTSDIAPFSFRAWSMKGLGALKCCLALHCGKTILFICQTCAVMIGVCHYEHQLRINSIASSGTTKYPCCKLSFPAFISPAGQARLILDSKTHFKRP